MESGSPSPRYHSLNTRVCSRIQSGHAKRLSTVVTERGLIESLLDEEDEYSETDCNFQQYIPLEVAEAITPWQDVAPNAKVVVQRKKRAPVHSADDAQVRARNRIDEYSKYNKKAMESLFTAAALWRMCVEQTTYRYIPNNGRYRSSKSENKLDRDGRLARTIRNMEKLSPEQRTLQKEIQRELRQEFEMQQRLERQAERNRQRAIESRRVDSRGHPKSDKLEFKKPTKDPLFHRRIRTPVELPPINVPLVGKAVNDTYLDSFSMRLNNLEEEMKRDQVLLKKKQQEYADENMMVKASQPFRTRSEPVGSSTIKSSHYMDFSGLPLFTEPVAEDCLSVRPISNHPKNSARDDSENGNMLSGRSARSMRDEEAMRTVFIKYTTSKGDVVRIPKYSSNVNLTGQPSVPAATTTSVNSSSDQQLVLRKSNGHLAQGKAPLRAGTHKEQAQHAREYLVSTHSAPPSSGAAHTTFKYTTARAHRKLTSNGVYSHDDEPPIIVAEGLFSRNKPGGSTENIQVTVTKRKREKSQDALAQGFIPGVAGKNCEVSQRI